MEAEAEAEEKGRTAERQKGGREEGKIEVPF